jgi:hypothetical protein
LELRYNSGRKELVIRVTVTAEIAPAGRPPSERLLRRTTTLRRRAKSPASKFGMFVCAARVAEHPERLAVC